MISSLHSRWGHLSYWTPSTCVDHKSAGACHVNALHARMIKCILIQDTFYANDNGHHNDVSAHAAGCSCRPLRQRCFRLRSQSPRIHGRRCQVPAACNGWPPDEEGLHQPSLSLSVATPEGRGLNHVLMVSAQAHSCHDNFICAGAGLSMQSYHRSRPALCSNCGRFQGVQQDQRAGVPDHEMRQAPDRVRCQMPLRLAHGICRPLLTVCSCVSTHPVHNIKVKYELWTPVV